MKDIKMFVLIFILFRFWTRIIIIYRYIIIIGYDKKIQTF